VLDDRGNDHGLGDRDGRPERQLEGDERQWLPELVEMSV